MHFVVILVSKSKQQNNKNFNEIDMLLTEVYVSVCKQLSVCNVNMDSE